MRLAVLAFLLQVTWTFCAANRPVLPIEPRAELPLVPGGGTWRSLVEVNLSYNAKTNRVLSVVYQTSQPEGYRVVRFDASTIALSGGERTAKATDVIHLDSHISPDGKFLFIAWGDQAAMAMGSEREIPIGVEQFNLETFDSSQSLQHNLSLYHFDIDTAGNRIVGLADPPPGATDYSLLTVDLDTLAPTIFGTGMEKERAIAKDALFDATRERLLVLFTPTIPEDPNQVEFEGQIVAYDVTTSGIPAIAEVTRSERFAGEFTPHSLAISRNGESLVVAPRSSNDRKIPILNAETLALSCILEASLSSSFETNGSAFFDQDDNLWIPSRVQEGAASIAVYDVTRAEVSRWISGATDTDVLSFSPTLRRVFAGSDSHQALHVLSVTDTVTQTHIDLQFEPVDMGVDPETGVFQVLASNGKISLFSEEGPTLLGMRLGVAYQPPQERDVRPKRCRILQDPVNERLYVTRKLNTPPAILAPSLGYYPAGSLPVIADTLSLDINRNRVYTAGAFPNDDSHKRILQLNGADLGEPTPVATLADVEIRPGLFFSAPSPIEMEVDEGSGDLWVLSPSLVDGPDSPTLRRFSFQPFAATDTLELPMGDVSELILDPARNRVFFTQQADPEFSLLQEVHSSTQGLVLGASYPMDASAVYDSAEDASYELAYFLVRVHVGTPDWRLAVWDLRTSNLYEVYGLGFLSGLSARMAFNPSTNSFAVTAQQGDQIYFFGNPVGGERRPNPSQTSAFASFSAGQTRSGIELNWDLAPEPHLSLQGVFVERRQDPTDPWIRLTPLPIPIEIFSWTDTTPEPGVNYHYRLLATGSNSSSSQEIILGPVAMEVPSPGTWIATIPEVVIPLEMAVSEHVMIAVSGFGTDVTAAISLEPLFLPDGFQVSIFPPFVPLPGTARVTLSCHSHTPPGVYGLIIQATDGLHVQQITLLISVPQPSGERSREIYRRTTPIALSSDSDLDQSRISIRGQLGLRRRYTSPLAIIVQAFPPDGSTQEVDVIAATGEFTADFSVPENALGDWTFVASMPGNYEIVGGRSASFSFPVQEKGTKTTEGLEDRGLGQIVIARGVGREGDPPGALNSLTDLVKETFLQQRYQEGKDLVESSTTCECLATAVTEAASRTNDIFLLYMLGDAEYSGDPATFRFLLPSGEFLGYESLKNMLAGVIGQVKPILILDCPHAGRLRQCFADDFNRGAYIFSPSELSDWDGVLAFSNFANFSRRFLEKAALHQALGRGLYHASNLYALPNAGFTDPKFPTCHPFIVDPLSPFYNLHLGSKLTPTHSLIRDSVAPVIRVVNPSESVVVGASLTLYAEVHDLPFDQVLSVSALVNHPDGLVETVELSYEEGSDLYTSSLLTRIPGAHSIAFIASDGFWTSDERTTIQVEGRVDPQILLQLLRGCKVALPTASVGRTSREATLFGVARSWYSEEAATR